jgi:hypothetical protein
VHCEARRRVSAAGAVVVSGSEQVHLLASAPRLHGVELWADEPAGPLSSASPIPTGTFTPFQPWSAFEEGGDWDLGAAEGTAPRAEHTDSSRVSPALCLRKRRHEKHEGK